MLERPSTAGGQLEVSEVEIEGWARSCGEILIRQSDSQKVRKSESQKVTSPLFCSIRKFVSAEQESSDWGGD